MVNFSEKTREDTSGFKRGDDSEKLRYDLVPTLLLDRVARIYTDGAKKYGENNWKKCANKDSFKQSAWRHFMAWQKGIVDEDHFAQLIWNLSCWEHIKTSETMAYNKKLHDNENTY